MYVTLPCDGGGDIFPNNTISKYTVKLPHELKFKEDAYEAALVSCSFPRSYFNVDDGYVVGYYENVSEYLTALNARMLDLWRRSHKARRDDDAQFHFVLEPDGRVRFEVTENSNHASMRVNLPPYLWRKLGFESSEENIVTRNVRGIVRRTPVKAKDYPDLDRDLHSIHVHCDAVEASRTVGSEAVPVLREVPVTGKHWTKIHFEPTHLEYFPLRKSHFSEITIEIKTQSGELVVFNYGKVVVDLHFRKRLS